MMLRRARLKRGRCRPLNVHYKNDLENTFGTISSFSSTVVRSVTKDAQELVANVDVIFVNMLLEQMLFFNHVSFYPVSVEFYQTYL